MELEIKYNFDGENNQSHTLVFNFKCSGFNYDFTVFNPRSILYDEWMKIVYCEKYTLIIQHGIIDGSIIKDNNEFIFMSYSSGGAGTPVLSEFAVDESYVTNKLKIVLDELKSKSLLE